MKLAGYEIKVLTTLKKESAIGTLAKDDRIAD